MAGIQEAENEVVRFLQKALDSKDVKVIGATKINNQWHIEAEVYEENSFLKSLGIPAGLQNRNIYNVKLNNNLKVEYYERQGHLLTTS